MAAKTVFELSLDNFDLFFDKQLETITPQAKESLPKDVAFKIFRKGGAVNSTSTSKLSFLAKLYILWKALHKNFFIVVEGDDRNGLTVEEFVELKQAIKMRDYGVDRCNDYVIPQATFVTGSKDLMQSLAYLNNLSTAPAYRYLMRSKNPVPNKVEQNKMATEYVCRFLSHYEASRKKIGFQSGINISEWLVLIHIYHGNEVMSNTIWRDVYKYSFNSSKTKIKLAFGTLQNRGYIVKNGTTKGAKIQITALGISAVNDILQKYAVNC
jgi:hypothetical protein